MTMDIHEILKRLPHRYPFLLVDRVLAELSWDRTFAQMSSLIDQAIAERKGSLAPAVPALVPPWPPVPEEPALELDPHPAASSSAAPNRRTIEADVI